VFFPRWQSKREESERYCSHRERERETDREGEVHYVLPVH
jgi:hypothetical protein